jgi:hypothetical protein
MKKCYQCSDFICYFCIFYIGIKDKYGEKACKIYKKDIVMDVKDFIVFDTKRG